MGSLTTCLRKAGALISAEDKAALIAHVAELKKQGITGNEAARQAITARLSHVQRHMERGGYRQRATDAEIGKRFAQKMADTRGADLAYDRLPDSQGGKVLSTDIARELSPDYVHDRTRSAAVHEVASGYVKQRFAAELKKPPKPGEAPIVLFTAGGTGAGKTTAIESISSIAEAVRKAQIVYDTNMNKLASAKAKIDQALAAGKDVQIVMVAREPVDALVNGALKRAESQRAKFGTGRTVPIEEHVKTHTGAIETVNKLAELYQNDPRVQIQVVDNSLGKGNATEKTLQWLKTLKYNDVEQRVRAALEGEREAGRISEETYQGFAGARQDARAAEGDRRVPQGDRSGLRQGVEPGRAEEQVKPLAQGDRGSFTPDANVLALFKGADLSTFLHESGHYFLEIYADVARRGGSPGLDTDMQSVLKWFGVKDLATWQGMTLEQRRPLHEKFARSFEQYLLEGKPPTNELRPMFARFRSWLLTIYRSARALGGELTDEVRSVFDRMLASEDAIREAEAQRHYEPLFDSAAKAGMTDKEFADYLSMGQQASDAALDSMQARSVRDMKWASGAKSRALRELQRQAAAERRKITEEVTKEVEADPAFSAQEMLRAHQGADQDVIAEMNGFSSADEMLKAIRDAGDRKDVIKAMTDQRMLERHGELTDPQSIENAANEAVHNEARARFMATGLKILTKSPLSTNAIARAAKEMAAAAIARKRVADLDPQTWLRAESRANRDAIASAAKDPQAAIEAQRAALINNRLARAALDAKAEVDKGVRYLNRAGEGRIDAESADQIAQLLDRFDLRKRTQAEVARSESLRDWIERQRAIGIEPDIPQQLLAEAFRTHYTNLSVEEFRGLVDTVKQIEHLGRLKDKLLTAQDKRRFSEVRDDLLTSIAANSGGRSADVRTSNTVLGHSWQAVKGFWADHIKAATWARIMDGGKDGGPMWERLIRPANDAGNRETVMRAKATKDLIGLLEPVLKEGKLGGKGEFFPSINRSLNKEARLAWALNTGNEGNLQRLLDGNGYTSEQIQPVLDSLTAKDWKFVQSVWDYFESYRPAIAEKERRVSGKEPDWVEPTPQTVHTADGQTLELKGGYYPIKYDPRASNRADQFATAEDITQQLQGAYTSATTRRSFTKTRAEEVKGRPLLESLDGIYGGVQEVIHDLAWHEFLIDANRLLRDDQIAASIRSTYGPEVHRQFTNWLQDIAVGEAGARRAGENALAWLRQGVSVAGLGFNVMSALIQPLGLTQSIVRIGPEYVGRGLAKAMGSPLETTARISEMSDFMATRFMTRNRELNELRNQVKGAGKVRRTIDAGAYALMLRAQQLVDIPTWWGAYEKAIAQGSDQKRAVDLADQAVIDSQGSGQQKDLSAIERGGPVMKLFTTFYSFFNTALNLGVQRTMNADSKARLAADYLLLYTVPAVLGAAMKDALTPGDSDNWNDPVKLGKKLLGEQLGYLFGLMFGLRELAPISKLITGEPGGDYQGPAGVRLLVDAAKLAKQGLQFELDDAFRKAVVNFVGDLTRIPSAQINRTITGAEALSEGQTENPAALLFGYQEPH